MWERYRNTVGGRWSTRFLFFALIAIIAGIATQPGLLKTADDVPDNIAVLCSLEDSFAVIAESARPGVVSITAVHKSTSDSRTSAAWSLSGTRDNGILRAQSPDSLPDYAQTVTATGSGAIVRHEGDKYYILTNQHVVGNATNVKVRLIDGTELRARVTGIDPVTDIAVVEVSSPKLSDKNMIPLGNSDEVRVGAWAIALGSPLGFDETMTVGVVSALQRQLEDEETFYTDLIQTDAAINRGNSGGPLLDVEGRVIGINTAIASPTGGFVGIGFAIPINLAKSVMDMLIAEGRVIRGWLGIGIQDLSEPLKEYYGSDEGALVASVDKNSPAQRAGLQEEDIILSINGTPIKDIFHMQSMIASARPGSQMKLTIVRSHQTREVSVVVAQSPRTPPPMPPDKGAVRRENLGLRVRTLSDDLAKRVGLEGMRGVIVADITSGGIAEEAGLDVGDVITRMNGQPVLSDKEFAAMVDRVKPGGVIVVKVIRDGSASIIGMKRE